MLPGLPLKDSDPVFAEPWQAQAFALAVELSARGFFTWKEWAAVLGQVLKEATQAAQPEQPPAIDAGARYYHCWVAALERLAAAKGLCDPPALLLRRHAWAQAYRHTPHGKPVTLEP